MHAPASDRHHGAKLSGSGLFQMRESVNVRIGGGVNARAYLILLHVNGRRAPRTFF